MEGAAGKKQNVEHLRGMNWGSRDLIPEFMKRSHENEERERDEEIELSLGLSMNGRFGVDPTRKRLRRSSSVSNVVIADTSVGNGDNPQARGEASAGYAPLVRASSMPSETLEWRRREEPQPVMSMEKLKSVLVEKEDSKCSEDVDGDGLHGDAASGVSNPHRQLVKEAMQTGSSSRPVPKEPVLDRATVASGDAVATDEESIQNALIDMPYVSTRGDGPNHNRIEGFLYRYKKAEEVKIVCVCHGMFLTPAEFVKHGGGGDVAHPLKHIVVNPFPLY